MRDGSVDLGLDGFEDYVQIGIGGFAVVYRARQPAFRRTVAIKVLTVGQLDDKAQERFERECHAMGSLSVHSSIVTLHEAGFTPEGRPYLVMEYMAGGSLADRLEREGAIPWQEVTRIGVRLAGALETAHRSGVVHRDLKPGNMLVSEFGDVRLSDFGIARIAGGPETRSGVITASIAHAPPEVLAGQRPTVAGDVYSLGSAIYELLTGSPAFASNTDESVVPMLARIASHPVPDLTHAGIPESVFRVVERAMSKDPSQRHQSAEAFGIDMQRAQRAAGVDSIDMALGGVIDDLADPATVVVPATEIQDAPPRVTVTRQRRADSDHEQPARRVQAVRRLPAWGILLAGLVGLASAVALIAVIVRGTGTPTPISTTTTTAEPARDARPVGPTSGTTEGDSTGQVPVTTTSRPVAAGEGEGTDSSNAAEGTATGFDARLPGLWSTVTVIKDPGSNPEPRDWAPVVEVYEWNPSTSIGDVVGRFAYRAPGLECVGSLTFVGTDEDQLIVRERLPGSSPCDDGGLVVLTVVAGGVLHWFYELDQADKAYTASADLRPDSIGFPGF